MTQFEKIEHERRYGELDSGLGRLIATAPREWRERLESLQREVMDEWHAVSNMRVQRGQP